jgi:transposase
MIGAIRLNKRPRLQTVYGAVNGTCFVRFLRRRLRNFIGHGDVVVMDNLNVHKSKAARLAIESLGGTVLFMPTYSPEFNPIELWWADLKRELRRGCARTLDALLDQLRRIPASTAFSKIAGWFRHCLSPNHVN